MIYTTDGRYHAEQDAGYESEMCPVTKVWAKTKRVLAKTWTIYETVGKPSYQTPVFFLPNEKEAREKLSTLGTILVFNP